MCDGPSTRADFSCGDGRGADHSGRGGRNRSVDFNCGARGGGYSVMKSCGGLVGLKWIFAGLLLMIVSRFGIGGSNRNVDY